MNHIKGISLSWIIVKNLELAVSFYQKNLGFQLKNYDPSNRWAELVGSEGGTLGISEENAQFSWEAGSNAIVVMSVENIEISRNELSAKGVILIGDIVDLPDAKIQSFMDLDGNLMQLIENK